MEAVLAHTENDLANLIASNYGDAYVVEMEGYGAIYAASQEIKPAIVVRGVSEAIADNMGNAPHLNSSFVLDRLETLLPHEAPLVARITDGLVRKWRDELGDLRTGTAVEASKLIDIAVTLHRLGPGTREDGTRLFEQLLEINAYTARETLDEIDSRFRQTQTTTRRPRLPRRTHAQRHRSLGLGRRRSAPAK
jgi:hypothetical protein